MDKLEAWKLWGKHHCYRSKPPSCFTMAFPTPQVLKKRMVAKFDASGANTVPFQQCIDEEIRILGRRVSTQKG